MKIEFDEKTHTYTMDGIAVPSVTQTLKATGFVRYHASPETELKMRIGRAVHRACHLHETAGIEVTRQSEEFRKTVWPYVMQWQAFLGEMGWTMIESEHIVGNDRYQYAGTLDRIYEDKNGDRFLIDIKTGAYESWHALQLAGYDMAVGGDRKHRRACVYLRDDRYQFDLIAEKKYSKHDSIFLSAVNVCHAIREMYGGDYD